MAWQKKSQFILVVFGILPVMLLTTGGRGDAKPVTDADKVTKTVTGSDRRSG